MVAGLANEGGELQDSALDLLLPFCQQVYNVALSFWQYDNLNWKEVSGAAVPSLPEDKYRKSLTGALMRHSGLTRQSADVELPKFMEFLPEKWFNSRVSG